MRLTKARQQVFGNMGEGCYLYLIVREVFGGVREDYYLLEPTEEQKADPEIKRFDDGQIVVPCKLFFDLKRMPVTTVVARDVRDHSEVVQSGFVAAPDDPEPADFFWVRVKTQNAEEITPV